MRIDGLSTLLLLPSQKRPMNRRDGKGSKEESGDQKQNMERRIEVGEGERIDARESEERSR